MKKEMFAFEMTNYLTAHDPLFAKMMMNVKMSKVDGYTVLSGLFGANWFVKKVERSEKLDPKIYTEDGKLFIEIYGKGRDNIIILDDVKYFWLIDSYILLCLAQNEFVMDLFNKRMEVIYGD